MNDQLDPIAVQTAEPPPPPLAKSAPRPNNRALAPAPAPKRAPRPPVDDEEEDGFLKRNRTALIVGAVVLGSVGWIATQMSGGKSTPAHKPAPPQQIMKVTIPPPPPTPPPLPPKIVPPKIEEKQVKQAPAEKPMVKVETKPKIDAPPTLGTGIKGNGPGLAGLGTSGDGGGTGTGGTGTADEAKRYYATRASDQVKQALAANPKTRTAAFANLKVKVWPDATGRITRAELLNSTGDAALDTTLREILTSLRLSEGAPPSGMKWMLLGLTATAQVRR